MYCIVLYCIVLHCLDATDLKHCQLIWTPATGRHNDGNLAMKCGIKNQGYKDECTHSQEAHILHNVCDRDSLSLDATFFSSRFQVCIHIYQNPNVLRICRQVSMLSGNWKCPVWSQSFKLHFHKLHSFVRYFSFLLHNHLRLHKLFDAWNKKDIRKQKV